MSKKIGIVNHWMVNNYGAVFLAYALEKTIRDMGYDAETIRWLPDETRFPWKCSLIKKIGVKTYLLRLGYFMVFIIPREKAFSNFRKHFHTSEHEYSDESLKQIDLVYDKIVVGGDQLWNTKENYYNVNNFLPFVKNPEKKVVYAASIAQEFIREDIREEFIKNVSDFSYITAREKKTIELIKKHTHCNVERVCDPAFLLTEAEWSKLAVSFPLPEKYIFVYQVQSDVELISFSQKLQKDTGLPIVFCPFPLKKNIKCRRMPKLKPEEWLWCIKNAEYVVTDAFHGSVFSLIFNREFYVQISSYGSDTSSRITDLLEVYQIKDRLLNKSEYQCAKNRIDYKLVNHLMDKERKRGMVHIRQMLDGNDTVKISKDTGGVFLTDNTSVVFYHNVDTFDMEVAA